MNQSTADLLAAAEELANRLGEFFDYAGSPVSDAQAATAMVAAARLVIAADSADWSNAESEPSLVAFLALLSHAADISRAKRDGAVSTADWASAVTALAAWTRDDRLGLV